MASDKISLTEADHRARAPQNLCYWRAPLAACWEEQWSDDWIWLCCLFSWGVLSTCRHSRVCYLRLGGRAWFFPWKPGSGSGSFCRCLRNPGFLIQKGHFGQKWWEQERLSVLSPEGESVIVLMVCLGIFQGYFLCMERRVSGDINSECRYLITTNQMSVSSLVQSGKSVSVSGDVLPGQIQWVGN